ncbi:autotransporter outer membrane beta-barrel domain-containing protein [Sulfitobacter donghicola]|uniref:Autotransporter domain-containing protein n=1 Tax=Sulfitobacter donghicola DSW-25 = KCTC 12864 = JCM 14565 TaxID=1300350 RepID=A0A073IH38_9RHOB|nr:autotransporter outer membrane beta-barrel domain-containing protein [Sulfitobacter donghicola]KEJ88875.1 hypothetical protein DSW25_13550 [Sulfitobacter donghicola DSW-25 = KCTC 12864 = JCM 14565]
MGYIRSVYAGSCTITASGDFVCAGASDTSDATQALSGAPLNVTTTPDFEIATQIGDALALTGGEGIAFTQTGSGSITGADVGLNANNTGYGGQSITLTGDVSGTNAGVSSVQIVNRYPESTAQLSITSTGNISATEGNGVSVLAASGISSGNSTNVGSVTLDVQTVTGGDNGIDLAVYGLADHVAITASGATQGIVGNGIEARTRTETTLSYGGGTFAAKSLTIQATDVSGGSNGILADHDGVGGLSITTTGAVHSDQNDGISATSGVHSSLAIDVVDVSGGLNGISSFSRGDEEHTISATGRVIGSTGAGITATAEGQSQNDLFGIPFAGAGDLVISAADVEGATNGIEAQSTGGSITVTSSGVVQGQANAGIAVKTEIHSDTLSGYYSKYSDRVTKPYLYDFSFGGPLNIQAVDVIGATAGVTADHGGYGPLEITTTGSVTAATGNGIDATHTGDEDLTISVVDVTASRGIVVTGETTGRSVINVTGAVRGGIDHLITASEATINVAQTGALQSEGMALEDGSTGTIFNLEGVVSAGDINLGAGDDVFNIIGSFAEIATATQIDGGDGVDSVSISNNSGDFNQQLTTATNFEKLSVLKGSELSLTDATLGFPQMLIDAVSKVSFSGTNLIEGTVSNAGLVSLQNGSTDDQLTIDGDLNGGGTIALDVALDETEATDLVVVSGDVTGTTVLDIAPTVLTGAPRSIGNDDGILLVDVHGQAMNDAFSLSSGPIEAGAFTYSLNQSDGYDFFLQSSGLSVATGVAASLGNSNVLSQRALLSTLPRLRTGAYPISQDANRMSFLSTVAPPQAWVRTLGTWSERESTAQVRAMESTLIDDGRLSGLQAGVDMAAGDRTTFTFAAHYTDEHHALSSSSNASLGSIDVTSYGFSIGATVSYDNGLFVDGQLSWSQLDTDTENVNGATGSTDGNAQLLAIGVGKEFRLANGLMIRPNIHYSYDQTSLKSFVDSNGEQYSDLDFDRHTVSAGVDLNRTIETRKGVMTLTAGTQLSHVFGGDETTTLSGVGIANTALGDNFATLSLGFEYETKQNVKLWGGVSHQRTIHGGDDESTSASLGVSFKF